MEGSKRVLEDYVPKLQEQGVQFAIASRTKSVEWAHALLGQFGIRNIMNYVEIMPGDKQTHFQNIRRSSGIEFDEMLFYDDARDGKFGNCEPVSKMGVLSVHCPNGLDTLEVFTTGLERYNEWDKSSHMIVEWDGSVTNTAATSA
jgi:magnesium-dependent phosphatase 1